MNEYYSLTYFVLYAILCLSVEKGRRILYAADHEGA